MPTKSRPQVHVKRAYDTPSASDGLRVLVDGMWPRGRSRRSLLLDLWLKDLAPSRALRKWFSHDPAKWHMFKQRYFRELATHSGTIARLAGVGHTGIVTLVFAAKDARHNNAVALKEFIGRHRVRPLRVKASRNHPRLGVH